MTTPEQSPAHARTEAEAAEAGDQPAEGATSRQVGGAGDKAQAEGER